MRARLSCAVLAGLATMCVSMHAWAIITPGTISTRSTVVTGSVRTHSKIPDSTPYGPDSGKEVRSGRYLTVDVYGYLQDDQGYCTRWTLVGSSLAVTDAYGRATVYVSYDLCSDNYGSHGLTFAVSSQGSDTQVKSLHYSSPPASIDAGWIEGAPYMISPGGHYWARRVGSGPYPITFVEGFDPGDGMKSGTLLGMLAGSRTTAGNLLGFVAYGYSFYIFNSGANGAASIKGNNPNLSDGMAYQAAYLAKNIHDTYHAGRGIVLGGYSMGGLVARAAAKHWCNGDYAATSGYTLDANCSALRLLWTGDAPLAGATLPVSILRYAQDGGVAGYLPAWIQGYLKSWAAREMVRYWAGHSANGSGTCSTDCMDFGGCSSKDPKFLGSCAIYRDRHLDVMSWSGGDVLRANGSRLPAVAFSVAQNPDSGIGNCYANYLGNNYGPYNSGQYEYLKNDINNARDHHLYTNSAAGAPYDYAPLDECVTGSKLNALNALEPLDGDSQGWFFFGTSWDLRVYFTPTFIASTSSLLWPYRDVYWKDYWYNSINANHNDVLPEGAGEFVMAWATEYLTGNQDRPVCNHTNKGLGKRGICRVGTIAERLEDGGYIVGDGICHSDRGETQWNSSDCAPACQPEPEVCDGVDNDCDGYIDESSGYIDDGGYMDDSCSGGGGGGGGGGPIIQEPM